MSAIGWRKKISNKIFKSIWLVAVSVFLASLVFIMGISYNYFSRLQKRQLKNETEIAARGVALSGIRYFENLGTDGYRITWIDAEGNILYDNEADTSKMENHLEREEVRLALKEGYGETTRYSSTLADKQLYAAKRLPDGSVLRLSIVQMAVWSLLIGFVQPIGIVIVIAFLLSFFLASRLAKEIVKPINEIELDHPEQYYDKENYKEVEPLLRRISNQQHQLKEDQRQIEKNALIRQEFSANVSHELKTPLHAISGYAELLENGMVNENDIRPFAGRIRMESIRMAKLVEDIIDLSKLDSRTSETKFEECDLYRIAENAVDSLEEAASSQNVTVQINGRSAPMKAVPQLLYSVIYNLCDNAIKYNRYGGSVTISVQQSRFDTVLSVKDNGIGIPKESRERIFERFYRVDKSRSREVGGTGLGLSIVKHAVMIHGGKIEVRSELGEGAEFIVTIPNEPDEKSILADL